MPDKTQALDRDPAEYADVDTHGALITRSMKDIETLAEGIGIFDQGKVDRKKMAICLEAQGMYWDNNLDLFEKGLLLRKEVELKQIAMKAEEVVEKLEIAHTKLMGQFVLGARDDIMRLLIMFGKDTTVRLREAAEADLDEEIAREVISGIREVWKSTNEKIKGGIDAFVNSLSRKDAGRTKRFQGE